MSLRVRSFALAACAVLGLGASARADIILDDFSNPSTGAQFVIPGYLLDSPVTDLGGMDLTWAFFAHSPLYSGFIAIGQLVAAALLTFDRTARLGAVVLLPITTNIACVNLGYNIGENTLELSLILLALNLYLLAGEFSALRKCFWNETASDPSRPHFMGKTGAAIARGAGLVLVVVGCFWSLTSIMNGPAGGQKAIAGDWMVESATLDGRPAANPALGEGWLWISFDPSGVFSVRTMRWSFRGKYTVNPTTGEFWAGYDPEPRLPFYRGPRPAFLKNISDAEERRLMGEQLADFQWPVALTGTCRKDGNKWIVTAQGRAGRVEWVLVPFTRQKF